MSITARPVWRIRLGREAGRYLLSALALAGIAASARFAIAPPQVKLPSSLLRQTPAADRAAEGYAALFARRYLSWSAAEPQASERTLEPFLGAQLEADAGIGLPATGAQRVEWDEVVQAREPAPGNHVYTVAAQTDSAGLLYLTVSVTRTSTGSLALSGYPAFVGPPATTQLQSQGPAVEVADVALVTVVRRALRNYLAGSYSELAADLTAAASVTLPALALELQALQRVTWTTRASSVLAVVRAQDARGVQYTLAYELDVTRTQGRWEISAVQTDPHA